MASISRFKCFHSFPRISIFQVWWFKAIKVMLWERRGNQNVYYYQLRVSKYRKGMQWDYYGGKCKCNHTILRKFVFAIRIVAYNLRGCSNYIHLLLSNIYITTKHHHKTTFTSCSRIVHTLYPISVFMTSMYVWVQ